MNIFRLPASLNGLKRVKIPSWISVSDGLQYSMKINSNGLRYSLTSEFGFWRTSGAISESYFTIVGINLSMWIKHSSRSMLSIGR
jgi:hypothetical protein